MSNHPAVEKSFAMLLSKQPNVLPNLLTHLEKGEIKKAAEILLSMLPYCRVMYFEPRWKQHSWGDRGLFFPATVNFLGMLPESCQECRGLYHSRFNVQVEHYPWPHVSQDSLESKS